MKCKLTQFEVFVADHHLSAYPITVTWEKLLNLVYIDSSRITIWCPFEKHTPEELYDCMESMLDQLKAGFQLKVGAETELIDRAIHSRIPSHAKAVAT